MGQLDALRAYATQHETKIRFLIVGGLNTIIGLGLFPILFLILDRFHIHYLIVFFISYIGSTTFSFLSNKIFVFKTIGNYLHEYLKFMSFQLAHFFVNLVGLPVLVEFFNIKPIIAQPVFAILVITTSYFWYSRVTFLKKGSKI